MFYVVISFWSFFICSNRITCAFSKDTNMSMRGHVSSVTILRKTRVAHSDFFLLLTYFRFNRQVDRKNETVLDYMTLQQTLMYYIEFPTFLLPNFGVNVFYTHILITTKKNPAHSSLDSYTQLVWNNTVHLDDNSSVWQAKINGRLLKYTIVPLCAITGHTHT